MFMYRATLNLISLLLISINAFSQIDLNRPFEESAVKGSITVFDYKNQNWIESDSIDSSLETVPASTFNIGNRCNFK